MCLSPSADLVSALTIDQDVGARKAHTSRPMLDFAAQPAAHVGPHAEASSLKAQYKPIAICTAKAVKRMVTAVEDTEARCTSD